MEGHAHTSTSVRPYILVLALLLSLTAITVSAAGVNFGSPSVNVVIALSIATVKASLVALYFMHLRHDKPMNAIIFVSGVFFLGVFLIFCFIDTGSRDLVRPANPKPVITAPAKPVGPTAH
jgi:cytochrome c oxidase subunit IV